MVPTFAADPDWHAVAGTYGTFQAPAGLVRDADSNGNGKAGASIEVFECPDFSLSFVSANGGAGLPKELQADVGKAVAAWSAAWRKNWKVTTYLEDEQHLAYAAIRTVEDPSFRDPRRYHLSFGFAAGDKPFAIHFRFQRPENLAEIERVLQSLKLKTQ